MLISGKKRVDGHAVRRNSASRRTPLTRTCTHHVACSMFPACFIMCLLSFLYFMACVGALSLAFQRTADTGGSLKQRLRAPTHATTRGNDFIYIVMHASYAMRAHGMRVRVWHVPRAEVVFLWAACLSARFFGGKRAHGGSTTVQKYLHKHGINHDARIPHLRPPTATQTGH